MAKTPRDVNALERDWESAGDDDNSARRVSDERSKELNAALGLQMISLRLQRSLIDDLKFIAQAHGKGYQPLIRDLLYRFVVNEKKQIIADALERKRLELEQAKQKVVELEQQLERQKVA